MTDIFPCGSFVLLAFNDQPQTVNVDILAHINFIGFMKMGNVAFNRIHVSSITDSLGYCKGNFQCEHISTNI